jgi:hypothetical protein
MAIVCGHCEFAAEDNASRCPACGAELAPAAASTGGWALYHTRSGRALRLHGEGHETWVGRGHVGAEIFGNDRSVSGAHCCFVVTALGVRLYDESSTNGTRVLPRLGMGFGPEVRLTHRAGVPSHPDGLLLQPGDMIHVQSHAFLLRATESVARPSTPPPPAAASAPSSPSIAPSPSPTVTVTATTESVVPVAPTNAVCRDCGWAPTAAQLDIRRASDGSWACQECDTRNRP